jgi:hypothetical protein
MRFPAMSRERRVCLWVTECSFYSSALSLSLFAFEAFMERSIMSMVRSLGIPIALDS